MSSARGNPGTSSFHHEDIPCLSLIPYPRALEGVEISHFNMPSPRLNLSYVEQRQNRLCTPTARFNGATGLTAIITFPNSSREGRSPARFCNVPAGASDTYTE